jgi:hypothetical protein
MKELILLCAGAAGDPPPDDAGLMPPSRGELQRLLARGVLCQDRRIAGDPQPELPEDAWLRERFAVPSSDCIEALAGAREGLQAPWWSLTPCHLHLGLDHAMLVDPGQLALAPDEAEALAAAVAEAFSAAGLALRWPRPDHWFALGAPWRLQAWPWTLASGRNVVAWQPTGDDGRAWRRLLTEIQMIWHDHPVNQARVERGQRPVNALWLNGFVLGTRTSSAPPGSLVHAGASPGALLTARPALAGLAGRAGWTVLDTPARQLDPAAATDAAGAGTLLIDAGDWRTARRLGDRDAWLRAWGDFDAWLAQPAFATALGRAQGRLRVVCTAERRLVELATPGIPAWRFWQRLDALRAIGANPVNPARPRADS